MKNILVLGAGQSATYLISHLLDVARAHDWFITVGDRNHELATAAVNGHPHGTAIPFEVTDAEMRWAQIERSAVVVTMLPQHFQHVLAQDCLQHGKHLISVSYKDRRMDDMANDAQRRGLLFLTEVGLDPGIDLMSAMAIIHRIRAAGGLVEHFESYGSGVPAPDSCDNPLRYAVTWNPRNVVMAGEQGAQYLEDGKVKIVPWHHLFQRTWPIEVPEVGTMEAYPNRDSLSYRDVFGLAHAKTLIRGTLRYPGWSETWHQIVRLGLPNENMAIPRLAERGFDEIVEMFLPTSVPGSTVEERVANHLHLNSTGSIMSKLRWLGLFSPEPLGIAKGSTAADAMIFLLRHKLALPENGRDMVVLLHDIVARYPEEGDRRERTLSTFVHHGEPGGPTAMARTVGLPAALAVELLLTDRLPLTGCHVPTHPAIYEPVLREMTAAGFEFQEEITSIGEVE